ncbi:hypothetical protein RYA05_03185 [Pseudomonas syringae pv. actinidiae]|nr:hypothetical protein [Pseudomonas syringae pv. actinidiae]
MSKTTYEIAYRDHRYLWSIGPAADMTGGYEDQQDLARLLANPTKAVATRCLVRQIDYWFDKGTDDGGQDQVTQLLQSDLEVRAIYERHVGILFGD